MHTLFILIWLGLCTVQDIAQRRISNWLTFGGLAVALMYLIWTGKSVIGASPSSAFLAFALGLVLTLPGYVLKRLGAGDVKLMAALGLATAPMYVLYSLAIGCVGQILGYVFSRWVRKASNPKVPFAPFVFAGFWVSALLLMN